MDPFVTPQWLAEHRAEVVLADARTYLDGRNAEAEYLQGHLPGAVFVDVGADLAERGQPEGGRHPLPTPEHFAAAMSRAGIGDSTTVVAYDDAGGVMDARLVWMLRTTGHRAALLDGGLDAFPAEERERHRAVLPAAEFTPVPWPREALATIDEAAHGPVVVDARDLRRARPGPRGSPLGAHPRCRERPVPGAPAGGQDAAAGRGAASAVRGRRGRGRHPDDLLLRLRHHGVPQPARGRARGPGHGTAVPRQLVPVLPHGPPGGDVPHQLNWPSGY